MKVIDCGDYKIVILQTPSDDESAILSSYSEDNLIYVPVEGYTGTGLSPERFLTKDPTLSFSNHLMWEGLFSEEDNDLYIEECCKKFHETGKQMVIENYEFQHDEPFYDYSK